MRLRILLAAICWSAFAAAPEPALAQTADAEGPRLSAYQASPPDPVDGRVELAPDGARMPLLRVAWDSVDASLEGWMSASWSERGVHLALLLPRVSPAERMPTGRSPDAPFVLHLTLGGGEGDYALRCVPLVEPISRMTTRHPAYLFNHRPGANARPGESGHAFCHEVSLLGIMADSLETRWMPAPDGGVAFEALIPWSTLRREAPATPLEITLRVRVDRPGSHVEWGGEAGPGRLRLIPGARPDGGDTGPTPPILASSVVRQPAPLQAAVPRTGVLAGPAAVSFELVDGQERVVSSAPGSPAGEAWMAQVPTRALPDGSYLLRVRQGSRLVGDRRVVLVAQRIDEEIVAAAAIVAERLAAFADTARPAWMDGHAARAREALRLAELPERLDGDRLERARQRIADARTILAALEAGRRPSPAEEGYGHPVGFAADGRHGPVEFIPGDGEGARLTVRAGHEAEWNLTPLLYGTFSEPVVYDRPIYGWLFSQALRNPSFEFGHPTAEQTVDAFIGYRELEPDAARAALQGRWLPRIAAGVEEVAAPWIGVGHGTARYSTECSAAFNDRQCQRVEVAGGARDVGIAQVVSLPAWREARYRLRVFLRSDDAPRAVRAVLFHDGRAVSSAALEGIGREWKEFRGELATPLAPGPMNSFMVALLFDGPGVLEVDLATLFPADSVAGFDPQAVAQLRALRTGWIRWPGGNLASGYRWLDGVGPWDRRPSLPNPSWPGLSSNFVGTDEYLHLSELVGTEPLITVNAGDGTAEEAARWVEYANGDTTTAMGRLRARNGHPQPYGVRYWNVGNELWGHWQVGYTNPTDHAHRYARFARAMRAADPSIRVIANGHGGHSESPPDPWNQPLLDLYGDELDIIDVHTYVGVPDETGLSPMDRAFLLSAIPLSYERWLSEFRDDLLRRDLDDVRVIVGEYNGSIRSASEEADRLAALLIYAAYLHAFIRQGEYIIGANATEYSPFNPRALPFGRMHPRYDLFRTYAEIAGTVPVEATIETPVVQQRRRVGRDVIPIFNLPLVDAVALKDPADGSLGISLINRHMEEAIEIEVRLEGFAAGDGGRWILFGAPSAIGMRESVLPAGSDLTLTLPPHSVSLLKIPAADR